MCPKLLTQLNNETGLIANIMIVVKELTQKPLKIHKRKKIKFCQKSINHFFSIYGGKKQGLTLSYRAGILTQNFSII